LQDTAGYSFYHLSVEDTTSKVGDECRLLLQEWNDGLIITNQQKNFTECGLFANTRLYPKDKKQCLISIFIEIKECQAPLFVA